MNKSIGIRAMSYWLPEKVFTLEELAQKSLLDSSPELLRSFGFDRVYVAGKDETPLRGASYAIKSLFAEYRIDPLEIDVFILVGALSQDSPPEERLVDHFRYPVGRLQYELGMSKATALSLGQQGCGALISAMRVASSLITAGQADNVLCVCSDFVPSKSKREVIYNVLSDGACALLVARGCEQLNPLRFNQVTKGYYWDTPSRREEIIGAYFPTAKNLIGDILTKAHIRPEDLALFIPHNINRRSWEILLDLTHIPYATAFLDNITRRGHLIGADVIMNLKDALQARRVARGAPTLLFNFGFGANWSAVLLSA